MTTMLKDMNCLGGCLRSNECLFSYFLSVVDQAISYNCSLWTYSSWSTCCY